MTTERSQVHALQSKHDPSVGGNSRSLSVWECQTQKPRLVEPSSWPPAHLPREDQHQRVGGTEMTQSPGSLTAVVVLEVDGNYKSSKDLQGKVWVSKYIEEGETGYIKKKNGESRQKRSRVHQMTSG